MQNTPAIKVKVSNKYLTNGKSDRSEMTEAYLLAVDCRAFDRIRFTVFLESGAIWSGLPIEAIWCERFNHISDGFRETHQLQPYTCLEGPYRVFEYNAMKNACLDVISGEMKSCRAYYLFTINYEGHGFAECPEQYKTHNVVVIENGQLAALPNNYIKVNEPWFTKESDTKDYRRDERFYFAGG